MSTDTVGIRHQAGLRIGMPELSYWQYINDERLRFLLGGGAYEPGWFAAYHPVSGRPDFGWTVNDPTNNGYLVLQTSETTRVNSPFPVSLRRRTDVVPAIGIDSVGNVLEHRVDDGVRIQDAANADIQVANDGVWRTLVAKYAVTEWEPGRLTLTAGSTTVTGVNTRFTAYHDSTDPRAHIVRIAAADSTAGNEGAYPIATVTDDENMTLAVAAPADESALPFRIQGEFATATPTVPDAHWNRTVVWEIVTRTVDPPNDALVAFDVMRTGGSTTIIDRRHTNIYRPLPSHRRNWSVGFVLRYINTPNVTSFAPYTDEVNGTVLTAAGTTHRWKYVDMAGCVTGTHQTEETIANVNGVLACISTDNPSGGPDYTIEVAEYTPTDQVDQWNGPNGAASRVVVATGTTGYARAAIVQLPSGSGATHMIFAAEATGGGNRLRMWSSTDHGATWSTASTLYTPGANYQIGAVDAVLTRAGRIIIVMDVDDAVITDTVIGYVYSDDLGATWNTNSNVYHLLFAESGVDLKEPRVCEDDQGIVWTGWERPGATTSRGRIVRGIAVNNPVPDASEVGTSGWVCGPVDGDGVWQIEGMDLLPMPDGGVIAFTYEEDYDGGTYNDDAGVYITHVGMGGSKGYCQELLRVHDSGGAPFSANEFLPVAIWQTYDGLVHMLAKSYEQANLESLIGFPLRLSETRRHLGYWCGTS